MIHMNVFNFIYFCNIIVICYSQLVVNIKNGGGDIVIENIQANTTDDSIELKFVTADGTVTSQLIDFPNEIQIFRAYILGEVELGQLQNQCLCFVKRFMRNEFISSDAMSRLRQKNPAAVRVAEDDRGQDIKNMDLLVHLDRSPAISPHIKDYCRDAPASTFTIQEDIKLISKSLAKGYDSMIGATRVQRNFTEIQRCSEKSITDDSPCLCYSEFCINWYPCGLKYCNGKDATGKLISYHCGIKTCKKCQLFNYEIANRKHCIWDMPISYL